MSTPRVRVAVPATSPAARDFYCPVCGTRIYGGSARRECPHLLFAYIDVTATFDFCRPELGPDSAVARARQTAADPVDLVCGRIDRQSAFVLEIDAQSDVSGPSLVRIGIDMSPVTLRPPASPTSP